MTPTLSSLLLRKVRGVRVVDLAGAACLVAIVLLVYGSKARAGAEAARIADTDRQIAAEEEQLRLLRAEEAYLTRPDRLRGLSNQYLNLGPAAAKQYTTPEALAQLHPPTAPPSTAPSPAAMEATR